MILQMDKGTVLEDAIKYIKELQKRVKELEEVHVEGKHITRKPNDFVGRSYCGGLGFEEDASSSKAIRTIQSSSIDEPEIVVRISGTNILVRIYCKRTPSLALKALIEMEKLHVSVVSSSVLPFFTNDLLITIVAQVC